MRNAFASAVIERCADPDHFFLTGDLGFMALENVRAALGPRFVNAGVAEQNMIGVAAGLAREGFKVFAYSIAPFCYARPFEQIRNDICLGRLPVCLVGNGGGYAYGYMGPTHHALEDCAAMTALGVRVLAPAFDDDIPAMLASFEGPTYLRLGYDCRPQGAALDAYAPWRLVLPGQNGILAALGPLAGVAWRALGQLDPSVRPAVWAVTELPLPSIPDEVLSAIDEDLPVIVIEEHLAAGGLGMQLAHALALRGKSMRRFVHHHAIGYPRERFGSQAFHRSLSGLDEQAILALINDKVIG
ncbi:transketolase [Noviherbaspirillum cavernae]|uniref:Transketolase n=2 Tax=Noviherbaspirillum cavernae TaxID=2320862 RepID=A0A418WWP2_9BURK|nr:transketolase [Noviherbaspirillum cavernae]